MSFDERGSAGADGASADRSRGNDAGGSLHDWTTGDFSHLIIPDDIRELDEDVRALHRERRAARRHRRAEWLLHGRRAVVVPVVLVLALIVGSYSAVVLVAGTAPPIGHGGVKLASPTVAPGEIGGLLPALNVRDTSNASQNLRSLRPAALLLLPVNCNCNETIQGLTRAASKVGVPTYAVSTAMPVLPAGVGPGKMNLRSEPTGQLLRANSVTTGPKIVIVRANGVIENEYRVLPPDDALLPVLRNLS